MTPVLELSAVIKDYRGLRPLRIDYLAIEPGEQLAVLGFDRPSAEVLINLIDWNMNVQDAVNWPRFHHQNLPDDVRVRLHETLIRLLGRKPAS